MRRSSHSLYTAIVLAATPFATARFHGHRQATAFPDCSTPCLDVHGDSLIQNASLCQDASYLDSIETCFNQECDATDGAVALEAMTDYCVGKGFDLSYTAALSSSTAVTSSSSTQPAVSTTAAVTSVLGSTTAIPSASASSSSSSGSLPSAVTAGIIGAVLGSLVLVLPVLVFVFYWRRHRAKMALRRAEPVDLPEDKDDDDDEMESPLSRRVPYAYPTTPISAQASVVSLPFDSTTPQLRVANPSDLPQLTIPASIPTAEASSSLSTPLPSSTRRSRKGSSPHSSTPVSRMRSATETSQQPSEQSLTPEQARALQGLLTMPRETVASVLQIMTTGTSDPGSVAGPPPAYRR